MNPTAWWRHRRGNRFLVDLRDQPPAVIFTFEIVYDVRDREYALRGSESRTLATVGTFRVVSARDLRDHADRPADPRDGDLRHLREQGLIETERIPGCREHAVVLPDRGRDLLEANRNRERSHDQEFYAGLKRERELEHDAQLYRAYLREAGRLEERGVRIERVRLDYELKREYQQWLHERDRDRDDYNGRPDRDDREIEQWALEHGLPYFDDQVHFPDFRIDYRDVDGREDHVDVEVTTVHYSTGVPRVPRRLARAFRAIAAAARASAAVAVGVAAAAEATAGWPRRSGIDHARARTGRHGLWIHRASGPCS